MVVTESELERMGDVDRVVTVLARAGVVLSAGDESALRAEVDSLLDDVVRRERERWEQGE